MVQNVVASDHHLEAHIGITHRPDTPDKFLNQYTSLKEKLAHLARLIRRTASFAGPEHQKFGEVRWDSGAAQGG